MENMEEKYPIKFSFSQFILLMSVGVVMLIFTFFMGARFGGAMFASAPQTVKNDLQALQPENSQLQENVNKLSSDNETVAPADVVPNNAEGTTPGVAQIGVAPPVAARPFSPLQLSKTMVRVKSSSDELFTLEIATLNDEVGAANLLNQWKQKGYPTYLAVEKDGDSQIYKVRLGNFTDATQAQGYADTVKAKENVDAKIVRAN